jgi:hypothetical protein
MTKSDKIREHFRKHPDAEVAKVAAKFKAPKPMTYKLRKQVQEEWRPPELLPVPEVKPKREWTAEETEEGDIVATLNERAKDYGKFKDGAALMQGIKRLLADHAAKHGKTFVDDQWEALEMIVHKIGRIVNGNPDKVDHWTDIAGYAKLVADRLEGVER